MSVQITVKVVGGEIVRQGLEDLENEIPLIGRRRIYETMKDIHKRMRQTPRRPTYPIDWDSDKQRRYVMALLREKGTIPYKPSGRYESGWTIVKQSNGYTIENDALFARYASGDYRGQGQSHIHEGRRPLLARVVSEEVRNLPEEIDKAISYYGREHNLIP